MRPRTGLEIQGRYELAERIALGGMGEVWRATDLRSGRAVAVKILRPELQGDEIFLSRLRAEAKNASGLRHPNLAVVLDAGERQGTGWIVMELVQGRPLSDILAERGTMPPEEILTILAQVARALQVVHDAGVVHRDVKPSNILITREGLAKLSDFGISTGTNQLPMTAAGMVMGTAQYLAPEQATGNLATPAGDLYSLGIIAYEALTGNRPFVGASQVDIAYQHVNSPVPPLPETVPAAVRQVVMELLAKRPAERPLSARELARRLDRIVIRLPQEDWDPQQGIRWPGTQTTSPEGTATASGTDPAVGAARSSLTANPASRSSVSGSAGGSGSEQPLTVDRRAPSRATADRAGSASPAGRGRTRRRVSAPALAGGAPLQLAPALVDGAPARRHGRSELLLVYTLRLVTLLVLVVVLALLGTLLSGAGSTAASGATPLGAVPVIPDKEAQ